MEAVASDAQAWVDKLRHLSPSSTGGHFWPPLTHSKDPGKPLLLLAIMDRIAENGAAGAEIVLDQPLRDRFELYCESVLGSGVQPPSVHAAFNGLADDGLWQVGQMATENKKAQLDTSWRAALSESECRRAMRQTLYETYFAAEVGPHLSALSADDQPGSASPLRDAFEEVLAHYNDLPMGSPWRTDNPLFDVFKTARTVLESLEPVRARGMEVGKLPAGTGLKAEVPWLPIYRESRMGVPATAWQAVYVFRPDMSGLYLTLGRRQAEGDTRALRAETLSGAENLRGQSAAADGTAAGLPSEAGSSFLRYYAAGDVPRDAVLEADLSEALAAYDRLVERDRPKRREELFGQLQELTFLDANELLEIQMLLEQKKQLVLEGPPGSGKTFVADLFGRYFAGSELHGPSTSHVVTVQFHQSYGYEDFVEGIRPESNEAGQLEYKVRPGAFKELCELARANPDDRYVMIIDEINRGNLSRIFGELLLLLEYRDKDARLAYGDLFSIPPNVYLIGTMNTTDRSLAQIDYALRRRFYFYRLMPVQGKSAPVLERWLAKQGIAQERRENALKLFLALNEKVQQELGEHFQIGHSYFMTDEVATDEGMQRLWRRAVMPLLEEYFYARRNSRELLDSFEIGRLAPEKASSASSSGEPISPP